MHISGAHGGGWIYDIMIVCQELDKTKCGFHVHLLAYPFLDQFFTRITALVESPFWNSVKPFYFISFHASNVLPFELLQNAVWTDKQAIIWVAIWDIILVEN